VLHHTGSMRQAIANCFGLVKRGGLFYLAIYNKKEGVFGSRFWLKVKMFYNRSSAPVRRIMEAGFIAAKCLRNPFYPCHFLKKRRRGMHSFTDVRDWLGGLPFEFASADEIMSMVPAGFEVVRTNLNKNNANLEYLFRKLG